MVHSMVHPPEDVSMTCDSFVESVISSTLRSTTRDRHASDLATDLSALVGHTAQSELSLAEEEQVLQAILNAIEGKQSSISSDLGVDTQDVEAVLDHAERVASMGGTKQRGTSVLHTHELHMLKDELKRARSSAGWPQCIDVVIKSGSQNPLIGVGTTIGLVLLYNTSKLHGICGSVGVGADSKGAVVAIAFNCDGSMVIAGHERGAVCLWDTQTFEPLRVLSEFEVCVLRVRPLIPDPLRFCCLDAAGHITLFSLSKVMSKYVARTSGLIPRFEDTQTWDIACVHDHTDEKGDSFNLAAVCAKGLTIFRLQSSNTNVVFSSPSEEQGCSNAAVEWISNQGMSLCACWMKQLEVFSLVSTADNVVVTRTASVALQTPGKTLTLMGGNCVLVADCEDVVHVFDAHSAVVVESMKLVGLEPVVFSHSSCGEKFQCSSTHCAGVAYILGNSKIMTCSVLSWDTRLNSLVELRMWDEALELAKGFALEVAVAVVGLNENPTIRRREVHDNLTQLLLTYIADRIHHKHSAADFEALIRKIIAFCASIDCLDILFGQVFLFFSNLKYEDLALHCLEMALLDGTVKSMPEQYIVSFVNLYAAPQRLAAVDTLKGKDARPPLQRAEFALMRIEDNFDALLEVARNYAMTHLPCVVLSLRQGKPTAPISECLKSSPPVAVQYLLAVLQGETLIPDVPFPLESQLQYKVDVLSYLLADNALVLEKLLHVNVEGMLNVLKSALADCDTAMSPWKQRNTPISKKDLLLAYESLLVDKSTPAARPWLAEKREWPPYAAVVEFYKVFALQVATEEVKLEKIVAGDFLVRAAYHIIYVFPKLTVQQSRQEIQHTLGKLFTSSTAEGVDLSGIEQELTNKRLVRALAAIYCSKHDYRRAIAVYIDEDNAPNDPQLRSDVFTLISEAVGAIPEGDTAALAALRSAVKENLEPLVAIDATALAQFVYEHLPEDHAEVLRALEGSSETYYRYLREMINNGGSAVDTDSDLQSTYIRLLCEYDPSNVYRYLVEKEKVITYDLDVALKHCTQRHIIDASIFLLEKTFQIKEAMQLLMSSLTESIMVLRQRIIGEVESDCAELHAAMSTCGHYEYEQLEMLNVSELNRTYKIIDGAQASDMSKPINEYDHAIQKMVDVGVELCLRHQNKMDPKELSDIWFLLLDRFAKPKRVLLERHRQSQELLLHLNTFTTVDTQDGFDNELVIADSFEKSQRAKTMREAVVSIPKLEKPLSDVGIKFNVQMQAIYEKYVSYILSHMVQALDLPVVVGKIVSDNEREKFGPFKPIIVDILGSLSFDLEVNRLCKSCTDTDTLSISKDLKAVLERAIVPSSELCFSCQRHLAEQVSELDSIRYYPCGHGFHEACCVGATECSACETEARKKGTLTQSASAGNKYTAKTKEKRVASAGEPKDINRIVRRFQNLRAKTDGGINYKELLQQYTNKSKESRGPAPVDEITKKIIGKGLLLAPIPIEPTHSGEMNVGDLVFEGECDGLTDEEIREIFGDDSVYVAPPPKPKEEPQPATATEEHEEDDLQW